MRTQGGLSGIFHRHLLTTQFIGGCCKTLEPGVNGVAAEPAVIRERVPGNSVEYQSARASFGFDVNLLKSDLLTNGRLPTLMQTCISVGRRCCFRFNALRWYPVLQQGHL